MLAKRLLFLLPLAGLLTYILVPRPEFLSAEAPKDKAPVFQTPPTEFQCRWAHDKIIIDGKPDEKCWSEAEPIDQFYLPWLGKDARFSKTKTKAKLLWDREYLYFFAELEDHDLFADITEQDAMLWFNDVFELFFKPAENKTGYYEFQVNAAGAKLDMFIPLRGKGTYEKQKSAGEFHMDAKVVLKGTLNKRDDKDEGWTVEGRIPWTDFMRSGGRPDVDEKWKFALCRYDYTKGEEPELSTSAPLKAMNYHQHEEYATLQFIGPNANARGLKKREALTTSTVVGSPDPLPPYRVERVYPNLKMNNPVAVTPLPNSDQLIYITLDKPGTVIRRMKDDAAIDSSEVMMELKGMIYDLCFHPQFAKNGYIYACNQAVFAEGAKKHCRVSRWTMSTTSPWKIDPDSEKMIIEWASDGHNGAAVCFGLDGMLYITSGDGTSDSDTNVAGQAMDTLLSKLLRIDVDHPDKDKPYSVPKDNPFVNTQGVRPETWAYGFRNPWRITCDQKTGHIWVGNNGQDLWEQAFFVRKGDNFGWSVYEGSYPFYLERKLGPTPHVKPALEHHHSEARSLTGGIVYYGKKYPDLVGAYIYGDYSTGRIWAAKHDGTKVTWHKEVAQTRLQIAGFGTDSKGELLIVDHNAKNEGGFYTFVPTPKDVPPSTFPKKLSDSGLFTSVKGHQMQPALIPYSVNSELWSDGAFKARWLGMPGADSKIEYNRVRAWGLPDQTVIVKSFGLEMEEGKPESRRWIETRFLTKQDKEWYGYSYIWNDEQTEGTLVESKGLDREYTIKTKDGSRKQKWHYPSRSECMVCHSRAANWVLGLSEPQMNRVHDYDGVRENQLEVLDRLGLLGKFNYAQHVREMEPAAAKLTVANQRTAVPTALLPLSADKYHRLADPYDAKADLDKRARSYLHSNCAHCHVEAGGGNSLFNVDWKAADDKVKLIDVKPVHHTFNLKEARLISPGHPESSILLHRIAMREAGYMPPLATSSVDQKAVEMIREWIQKMPARKDD